MAFDNTKVYDYISIFNGLVYETTGKKRSRTIELGHKKTKYCRSSYCKTSLLASSLNIIIEYQVTNLGNYCNTKEEYVWEKNTGDEEKVPGVLAV